MPNPDPIPEAWLDAFADGWHSVPEGRPGDRRRAGLAAVRPLIETETREHIAQAIDDVGDIDPQDVHVWREAARIARGDNTGHEQEPAK